jgi:3-deoxy-7-phosphoheptulonate synthase
MIVVLKPNLPLEEVEKVIAEVAKLGYEPRPIHGKVQTVIAKAGSKLRHVAVQ